MTKVIAVGGEFINKGSEAMVLTTRSLLNRNLKNLDFTVASYHAKKVGSKYYGLNIIRNPGLSTKCLLLIKAAISRTIHHGQSLVTDPLLSEWENVDLIVDISGFAYTDKFGLRSTSLRCSEILLSRFLKKPFVIFPQSMGPFDSILSKTMVRLFLPYVDLIFVRGSETRKYLEDLKLRNKEVHVSPDITFLFHAATEERANEILRQNNIGFDDLLIGIMPNMRIYERNLSEKSNQSEYLTVLVNIVDFLVEEFDAKIVLLPHEYKKDGCDDRKVIADVMKELKRKEKVFTLKEEYSSADLKAVVGKMDLLITSRFHGAVAGLSMRVPTFVIGWAHKYQELMGSVGQEKFVEDYHNLDQEKLKKKLSELWISRRDVSENLESEVSKLEKLAEEPAIRINQLLKSRRRTAVRRKSLLALVYMFRDLLVFLVLPLMAFVGWKMRSIKLR